MIGEIDAHYVMRTCTPNVSNPTVNTDTYGKRFSVSRAGTPLRVSDLITRNVTKAKETAILLGASTAFGIGATSDDFTVPSILNKKTELQWYNLGGRAYNSTQEMINLALHCPVHLKQLIILSGINNLTLCHKDNHYADPVYNAIFSSHTSNISRTEIRNANTGGPAPVSSTTYDSIMTAFRRDIRIIKSIAEVLCCQVHFVLQPVATWLNKTLSPQEKELFSILDNHQGAAWYALAHFFRNYQISYTQAIASACADNQIPFLDANKSIDLTHSEWLFVDRVHLTNKGYEVLANLITKEIMT